MLLMALIMRKAGCMQGRKGKEEEEKRRRTSCTSFSPIRYHFSDSRKCGGNHKREIMAL
jgi:hypothetical protein